MTKIVIVGDALLDIDIEGEARRLSPEAPVPVVEDPSEKVRPGGAGLAAVIAAAVPGTEVALVTALGNDHAGDVLRALLAGAGVDVVDLGTSATTGEKIRIRSGSHHVTRLDRGVTASGPVGPLEEADAGRLGPGAILVADYGRGVAEDRSVRRWLERMADKRIPLVWDPHSRGACPVRGVRVATPNRHEALLMSEALRHRNGAGSPGVAAGGSRGGGWAAGTLPGAASPGGPALSTNRSRSPQADGISTDAEAGRKLRWAWGVHAVAVTRGASGALLVEGEGPPAVVQPIRPVEGDACGAGDSFAVAVAGALAAGALVSEAVASAVDAASHYVAAGGPAALSTEAAGTTLAGTTLVGTTLVGTTLVGTTLGGTALSGSTSLRGTGLQSGTGSRRWPGDGGDLEPASEVADRVRLAGGTVVATGGCFDLLHMGHLRLLERARALGDCLVVLVNSDSSVRRLKGTGRPLVNEKERAALLAALKPVDAVVVFDEDDPGAALERLRPDLFVKGGDYAGRVIPEAAVLARWGGNVVTVPYLSGRSTSELVRLMSAGSGTSKL